jgi:hypothetical protein
MGARMKVPLATVSLVVVVACASVNGQTRWPAGTPQPASQRTGTTQPTPSHLYGDTWFDFFLRQFNPGHLDRGAWLEQRRQMFLDATARNPFFKYSLTVTLLLLIEMAACAKLWYDLRKTRWIDAEKLADVLRHDLYSREAAREAIRRHNEHIEKCNRVVEAQEAGLSLSGRPAGSEVEALRAELQETAAKLAGATQERDQLKAQLDQTGASVADLSLKVESLSRKGNGHAADGATSAAVSTASNADLVRHINNLQQQLHSEREKNKRLKGG